VIKVSVLRNMKAVITAGGIGTRLLPFSKEIPKEMAPILMKDPNGSVEVKPIIQAIYEQLYDWGIKDFLIVVGRGKRAIEDHFTADLNFVELLKKRGKNANGLEEFYKKLGSSNIVFIPQPEALGFGDAVLRARPYINGEFLVHAGDTYVISKGNDHLRRLHRVHKESSADATVLLQTVENPKQYGVVVGEEKRGVVTVKDAVEKPKEFISDAAIMPLYIFDKQIFSAIASSKAGVGGELQLTSGIQKLAKGGKKVMGVKMRDEELRLDIGSAETLLEAMRLSSKHLGLEKSLERE